MESNCTICLDQFKYPLGKPDNCEHKFCFKCISDWFKKRSQCPLCGITPKYLIKIEENENETKVPVKKRTAKQFENELLVREQLEDHSESVDVTIEYANCRSCRRSDNEHLLLLCDGNVGRNADGSMIRCNVAYHSYCLPEKLEQIPEDDWFCPFCANKPENAKHLPKQTNLNVLPSEAGTSNSILPKDEKVVCQDSRYHSDGNSKKDEVKVETTECSSTTDSKSIVIHGAYGDSDAESESIESNCSDENSELYSETDVTADNYDDDDYEETDFDKITGSSNEITVDDSEAENTNGKLILLKN
ncbi:PHD-finger family protein [Loa loa]|uniref:PHD-finger family protein n=1 Tax=Loa loa TaxID=7209 RepID=A0A1I7W2V5_LOALO|nr:PHD-finger family protein [Loa loa]EFO23425.1 PHD-finger family protein [Loa loa]